MRSKFLLSLAVCGLIIGGCATNSDGLSRRDIRKDQYNEFAGEPVRKMRMIHLRSWTGIDRDQVVIWTSSQKAYLLDLFSPCLALETARAIAVSNFGNTVYAGSDSILVGDERCQIDRIRPLDTKGLKAARRGS